MEHYKSKNQDVPEELARFQPDNYDITCVPDAIRDALDGKKICLLVTDGTKKEYVKIGLAEIEGWKCLRYLGENNDPIGAGSCSVVPSWYKDKASDLATLSSVITYYLSRVEQRIKQAIPGVSVYIFRMENLS